MDRVFPRESGHGQRYPDWDAPCKRGVSRHFDKGDPILERECVSDFKQKLLAIGQIY